MPIHKFFTYFFSGFEIRTQSGETKLVTLDKYLQYMEQGGVWGDGVMMSAAALTFGRDITVISATTKQPIHEFKCSHLPDVNYSSVSAKKGPNIFLGFVSFGTKRGGTLDHYVSLLAENSPSVSQSDGPSSSLCSGHITTPSTSQSSDTGCRGN